MRLLEGTEDDEMKLMVKHCNVTWTEGLSSISQLSFDNAFIWIDLFGRTFMPYSIHSNCVPARHQFKRLGYEEPKMALVEIITPNVV